MFLFLEYKIEIVPNFHKQTQCLFVKLSQTQCLFVRISAMTLMKSLKKLPISQFSETTIFYHNFCIENCLSWQK